MEPVNCTSSEVSTYLQALEEGYLATFCLDTIRSAPLKSIAIASKSFQDGKQKGTFPGFQFTMMLSSSTEDRGGDSRTSLPGDSLARTSALPEKARASVERAADSGATWQGSLAKYDRQSRGWKTHQHSLYGGLIEYSETWPRWGMMRDGELYPLPTPSGLEEHRAWITCASASGLSRMQTLVADDAIDRKMGKFNNRGEPKLSAQVKMMRLGTPTSRDWKDGTAEACKNTPENGLLGRQIHRLPTVRAQSKTGGGSGLDGGSGARAMMSEEDRKSLTGGSLNPAWTEWFMGFPIGWSALAPLETARFQQWWLSHGGYSMENSNLPNPVSPA